MAAVKKKAKRPGVRRTHKAKPEPAPPPYSADAEAEKRTVELEQEIAAQKQRESGAPVVSAERLENLRLQVAAAEQEAYAVARQLAGGMVGPASSVVHAARMRVIEMNLAALSVLRGGKYNGLPSAEAMLSEMRDYWQAVEEEIASGGKT